MKKFTYGLICIIALFFLVAVTQEAYAQSQQFKTTAVDWIESNKAALAQVADAIWEFAELELKEVRSSNLLAEKLEAEGFEVERGVAGLDTAFTAKWGNGRPFIGILAEYDALPGLSQRRGDAAKNPLVRGAAGHGCGHNLFGAACLGAAMAVKQVLQRHSLPGTIIFYGCPAEETVVGKVVMAKAGLFDDLDAAITWHPGSKTRVTLEKSLALNNFEIAFHGKTAHGAADPWNGRSALDALEMLNFGINLMREHVKPTVRMHYVVKNGGGAPNVVPDYAQGWYFVRDVERSGVRETYNRVLKIAKGAAMATETQVEVNLITGVHDELVNEVIAEAHYRNLQLVGLPHFTEEEQALAKTIQKNLGLEENGLSTTLETFEPDPSGRGSTDVAEVSRIVPLAEFTVTMAPLDAPWHSWVVVSCGGTSIGHKAMVVAAKTLAATALDLLTDAELLAKAKKEFEEQTQGKPYVSPLDENTDS